MSLAKIRRFIQDKQRVADTYYRHGLLVESRDMYASLLSSLKRIEKEHEGEFGAEDRTALQSLREPLEQRLGELDSRIRDLHSSSLNVNRSDVPDAREGESPESLFQKGIGFRDLGLADEALKNFQLALEQGFSPYACLMEMIRLLNQGGMYDQAVEQLEGSLSLPGLSRQEAADLQGRLGLICEKIGRHADALRAFRDAADADPSLGEKLRKRIELLEQKTSQPLQPGARPKADVRHAGSASSVSPVSDSETLDHLTMETNGPSADREEVERLHKQIENLRAESEKLRHLLDEYQKRYQDILNFSNTLQKENRELKKQLESGPPQPRGSR